MTAPHQAPVGGRIWTRIYPRPDKKAVPEEPAEGPDGHKKKKKKK
jgi:hypothetical protein